MAALKNAKEQQESGPDQCFISRRVGKTLEAGLIVARRKARLSAFYFPSENARPRNLATQSDLKLERRPWGAGPFQASALPSFTESFHRLEGTG
jgi:hypothetical protein